MENTIENKSKFMAPYYRQKVLKLGLNDDRETEPFIVDGFSLNHHAPKNSYLELTPLSDLTDEDAFELAKIVLNSDQPEDKDVWIGDSFIDPNGDHTIEIGMRCWEGILKINAIRGEISLKHQEGYEMDFNVIQVVDFLRSHGYAMPFSGLSVETLISYGWVKLKEKI